MAGVTDMVGALHPRPLRLVSVAQRLITAKTCDFLRNFSFFSLRSPLGPHVGLAGSAKGLTHYPGAALNLGWMCVGE